MIDHERETPSEGVWVILLLFHEDAKPFTVTLTDEAGIETVVRGGVAEVVRRDGRFVRAVADTPGVYVEGFCA